MKIDKKHFWPIRLFGTKDVTLEYAPCLEQYLEGNVPKKVCEMIQHLATDARASGNIFTASSKMDDVMHKYREAAVKAFINDPERTDFGGAYLDMTMPVASVELFHFVPYIEHSELTGKDEVVIKYLFANIQDNKIFSNGVISFTTDGEFVSAQASMMPKIQVEQNNCIRYMTYLFELCCIMKYCSDKVIDIVTVYGNQRRKMPDCSDVIDNRSGVKIKCVCAK